MKISLLILLTILLFTSCDDTPKVFKVEYNSGKIYRVKSTGYFSGDGNCVYFWGNQGMFHRDSIKSITVESNYE